MEVHQLVAVVAVADHGSFSAAAEALGLAQPSVSQAVRTLEREVGAELFDRSVRGAQATAAGEALLEHARRALREADAARAAVAAVSGLEGGHLDLACIPTVAADVLAPLVGRFRRAHPGVRVRVVEPAEGEPAERLVTSGRTEVAVTTAPVRPEGVVVQTIATQALVAYLPPAHPLATSSAPLALARLGDVALVAPPSASPTARQLRAALEDVGVTWSPLVETEHRESILALVAAGAGVAVLPQSATVAGAGELAVRPLDPPLEREVLLVHHDRGLAPAAAAFVRLALG